MTSTSAPLAMAPSNHTPSNSNGAPLKELTNVPQGHVLASAHESHMASFEGVSTPAAPARLFSPRSQTAALALSAFALRKNNNENNVRSPHENTSAPSSNSTTPDIPVPAQMHPFRPSYGGMPPGMANYHHHPQGRWWPNPPMMAGPPPHGNYYHAPYPGQHHHMAPYPVMNQPMMAYPPMVPSNKQMRGRSWSPSAPAQKRNKQDLSVEEHVYSRKLKSLGVLAETFVQKHRSIPPETTVIVDDLARSLGVERRRVYDVVNILESMGVVVKKSKNTYLWLGMENLTMSLGRLQEEAIRKYPDDARTFRLISEEQAVTLRQHDSCQDSKENKSLSRLTQSFLECFLVGHKTMSLPEASDKIHGSVSTIVELAKLGGWVQNDEVGNDLAMHKAAAKGLKTKIRRLYDVSNVLFHLGWINKVAPSSVQPKLENDISPLLLERRPQYQWNYLSAHQIRQAYLEATVSSSSSAAPLETTQQTSAAAPLTRRVSLEDDGSPAAVMGAVMGTARRISLDAN